jgi:choline dehydrogenase-like flavoprotein
MIHLNLGAKQQNTFDAIVVGSGISGGWAAKELCEAGLKVLLLERGKNLQHPNYPTAMADPWQLAHAGRLTQDDRDRCPIQTRHFSYGGDNKHFYINDLENPYSETKRFDWIRGDIVGGRSVLWGRHCYRWSDLDFEANQKDGIAIDWPIRYKDIAPWYDYVEKFARWPVSSTHGVELRGVGFQEKSRRKFSGKESHHRARGQPYRSGERKRNMPVQKPVSPRVPLWRLFQHQCQHIACSFCNRQSHASPAFIGQPRFIR